MEKRGIKRKKAQGHVEMIISFTLFIGVLIIVFIFMNPFAKSESRDYLIDEVTIIFMENTEANVGKLSIISNTNGGCYRIPASAPKANHVEIWESSTPRKYILYFSDIFPANISPHKKNDCPSANYSIGVFNEENILTYAKIQDIKNRYEAGYEGLRENLGMPSDFAFQFRDFTGNIVTELSATRNLPSGVERNSKEFPVRVIDNQGGVRELILNIRSW
jgi:hypothetical protein